MLDLSDKVAIVTGASRGIGKTIATTFANAGAHVVCVARTTDKIEQLSEKINSNGGSSSYTSCDIGVKDNIYDMMQNVILNYGKIDILVNNAGITKDSLLLRMKEEGMIIGSHTENHPVMSKLTFEEQLNELKNSFSELAEIVDSAYMTYCHPYGGFHSFNDETVAALNSNDVDFSFNVEPRDICNNDFLSSIQFLPRYDCNLFPFGKAT